MNRNHRIDLNHTTFYDVDDDGGDDDDDANATSSAQMHVFANHVKHYRTVPENLG